MCFVSRTCLLRRGASCGGDLQEVGKGRFLCFVYYHLRPRVGSVGACVAPVVLDAPAGERRPTRERPTGGWEVSLPEFGLLPLRPRVERCRGVCGACGRDAPVGKRCPTRRCCLGPDHRVNPSPLVVCPGVSLRGGRSCGPQLFCGISRSESVRPLGMSLSSSGVCVGPFRYASAGVVTLWGEVRRGGWCPCGEPPIPGVTAQSVPELY